MSSFDYLWQLLETHGVIPNKKRQAEEIWKNYPLEVQRYIYRCIRDKLRAGKFVNYDPVLAIINNLPPRKPIQIISADEYYRRFGTQTNQNGWVRTFLPEQQKTIYVKQ